MYPSSFLFAKVKFIVFYVGSPIKAGPVFKTVHDNSRSLCKQGEYEVDPATFATRFNWQWQKIFVRTSIWYIP